MSSKAGRTLSPGSLLSLPLELREIIYNFCAIPKTVVRERKTLLNLIHVNRQIRKEAYALFCDIHTLQFHKPLELANKYLAYLQEYQVSALRNLRLHWKEAMPFDGTIGRLLPCPAAEVLDIKGDLRNLVRLWVSYPELALGIRKLEIVLPQSRFPDWGPPRELIMGVSAFLDEAVKVTEPRTTSTEPANHLLVEVSCSGNGPLKIIVRASPSELWRKIEDFCDIQQQDCSECASRISWRRPHWQHEPAFDTSNDIAEAVDAGKMYSDALAETLPALGARRWKIFFHPRYARKNCWIRILREVRIQQANAADGKNKKRKRTSEMC